jgi:flavin reductase (DIM6/NTAB) family NADH-FMN oxidoreductase RutF/pimeloyl-ACP methyl ester carboxylesterase
MSDTQFAPFIGRDGADAVTGFWRRGRGEPVVLVHGVGVRKSFWAPQMDALGERFDVIAYDMLGHGESSLPLPDARLNDYARQLLALVDRLGILRCHLVGHSMGASVALEFALSHPDRVRSLVAMNAVYCRTPEQRAAVEARAVALDEQRKPQDWDSTIARWFGQPPPERWIAAAAAVRALLSDVDPAGYARTYRVFAAADTAHRDRLPTLVVPALFLTGEHDPNSTAVMSEAMARLVPKGRAQVIPGERHMMSLTAPQTLNRVLIDFAGTPLRWDKRQLTDDGATTRAASDRAAFRKALGSFITGVTIVATRQADGQPRGFTANSFTSVSLEPPLILVCVSKTASSCDAFVRAGHFSVSVLAENQADLSSLFASKASDKFERITWREGPAGSPLVDGATTWFDCRSRNAIDAGDHIIMIGEVIDYGHGNGPANPLAYYRGAHVTLALSPGALVSSGNRTRVGALLERERSIVLIAGEDGLYDLPVGAAVGEPTDSASLTGYLRHLGIAATLDFLFAVFENPKRGPGAISIYYRGTVTGVPASDGKVRLVPFNAIPWPLFRDDAVRSMLRRFVQERSEDAFGIYVGDCERGTVQTLTRQAGQHGMESPS